MEAPISASQGPMRSLPRKLESLLSGPKHELRAEEKRKLRVLQADLQGLIDNYVIEPSEVVSPALTAHSWMKDVRDLSYDIDDFIYELAHVGGGGARISVVQKPPRFKICRFPERLKRSRRWVTDEISRFRTRVEEAIRLHKECLRNFKWRPRSSGQPPPSPCGRLVGVDSSIQKLYGWLANDGQPEHRVVSIVGTAGVGKTTLAREVFRRLRGQFQCLAFVRTSPKADMKSLLTSVLSQVRQRCHLPDDVLDVHKLIVNINTHLQHKTYLIVIEDLWALSTWDLVNRALPKGNWCTRILTTTETEVIAQTCCADNFKFIPAKKKDNSKFIIKKEPLSEDESRELFSNRAFGKQADCPQDLKEISNEIVKISGGLPLGIHILASLLAHHPASNIEQWNYVRNSLSSDLTTYGSLEKINQALIIGYDDLPHDLKACMLYLCLYEEDCVIWKDDLVKQWIAEGFISAVRGGDEEQVAHSYFGELVNRGLIQPVDTNCSDEILSCSVHHMVLHFIRSKSMEDNFCIAVDHSQITIRLADNVRRLGLHLGNVEDATPPGPESMRLSKVRSVAFSGFHKCMPSVVEFRFLQVLNLKLSVDPGRMMSHSLTGFDDLSGNLGEPGITSVPDGLSYNLAEISELFLLRYFHLDACHMSVALPTKMQQLKYLVAWEIDAEVTALPSDIVDLPALLYLRIPSEARLPTGIGRMTCLRTLGVFDLSMNSTEDVMTLGELTSLQDLHLTCSTLQPDNLERNLECLGLAIRKLSNLKCVTLVPADSSRVNTQDDAGASSMSTSWNGFNTVPLPPALLQKLELSRRCCLFSSLPEWTKELTKLCILKIAVREVSQEDVIILRGLPSLTALSLFIWTAPARRIIFDNEGFPVLKYFKFLCAAPCLQFLDAAMPNVRKLKLGFNANRMHRIAGLKQLIGLNEISIKIGDTGAVERQKESTQSVLTDVIGMDPSTPVINVQWVDWNFCGDDEKHTQPQEEIRDQTSEHQNVTAGGNSDLFIEKEAKPWRSALIEAHIQVKSSDEQAIQEKKLEEDVKKQPDTRSNAAPESTFHLQNTAGGGSREENMRDPFNAPVDLIHTDRRVGNELTRTSVTLSARDYALQNGDAKPFVPGSDTLARQGASLHDDLIAEEPNARFMDPETKELYFRSRTQEEEILLLRKKIADSSSKELQLLSEKHILERKLADLRMAVDERQEDAISGALKQLNEKRNHIEENMRLSNDLKVQEEELYLFTSSLLGMLAEYNVRPPQIYASTITTVTKRLYQQMQWKIRSLNDSLGDTTQPGDVYNPNHQQATPLRNEPSPSYNMEPNRNTFRHYAQDSNDRHAEQMYRSTFNQDIVSATPSNYFQENAGPREARLDDDSQFYRNDNQEYSADGDPLPGIEGFQIIGDPRPGSNLTACGFPTNGTTLCNFQWVRCLEDGTRQSIEGATMYDYVVTADDVGTLLAVDCTPMDDNGRQGDLVRKFANDENKISCDPDMQNDINICISRGRADFDVYVLLMNGNSPEEWELATLVLKRTGYQINLSNKDEVFIDEKYSPNLEAKIPNGRTTQFVLVSSGGVNLPFNTQGIAEQNSEDNDVRLRDLIVLVMRTFQKKALDAKRKGKA